MSISITDFHQVVETKLFSYTYYKKPDMEMGFGEWKSSENNLKNMDQKSFS